MPTRRLPVTTYRVSSSKPDQRWGSPGALPLYNTHSILIKVPIDHIPEGATITSALLQFYADRPIGSGKNVQVKAPNQSWLSSVTWNNKPSTGATLDSLTTGSLAAEQALGTLDVTSWANSRSRNGLMLTSTTSSGFAFWLRGSAGPDAKPVLIVTYTLLPDPPDNLRPSGGSVSKAQPVLTYVADEDMTSQKIQYSTDGTAGNIVYDSGWLPATDGIYDPLSDPGTGTGKTGTLPVLTNGGAGIWWRAWTRTPQGDVSGPWAYYEYDALPTVNIINPPDTTDDGSPTLTWTATSQSSWKAQFWRGGRLLDETGWKNQSGVRDWTPQGALPVPNGHGTFKLWVRDSITPRVAANNARVDALAVKDFSTVAPSGSGSAIDSINVVMDGAVPKITGTRDLGTPDSVSLYRDGVRVPLWDNEGNVYTSWAPATPFFNGSNFTLRDYTASPRTNPVYSVRVKVGSTVSAVGPTKQFKIFTPSVWLVDPRGNDQVEILGLNDLPVVDQATDESSIVHTPINGGSVVEAKRRRLVRTTRYGSISGLVVDDDEALLDSWVEADSGLKYRLIFGKVNWPVIIGDYSPQDTFYNDACDEDQILVALNFWQRLTDL